MEIEIIKIDLEAEIIKIKVLQSCNLNNFIVADRTFSNNAESNKLRNTYWFESLNVKKGDFIWLYVECGKNSKRGNDTKTTTYLLYWNLDRPILNNSGDSVTLIQIAKSVDKAITP